MFHVKHVEFLNGCGIWYDKEEIELEEFMNREYFREKLLMKIEEELKQAKNSSKQENLGKKCTLLKYYASLYP